MVARGGGDPFRGVAPMSSGRRKLTIVVLVVLVGFAIFNAYSALTADKLYVGRRMSQGVGWIGPENPNFQSLLAYNIGAAVVLPIVGYIALKAADKSRR
jgi:hypothetical protein